MLKGVVLKLYPTKEQKRQLTQMFGNNRFVYNQFLNLLNTRYKNNPNLPFMRKYDLSTLLTQFKNEHPFLKESDSESLQVTVYTVYDAFRNFFAKRSCYPKFKSKHTHYHSYTGRNSVEIVGNHYLRLRKLGVMKTSKTNYINGVIKRYTVSLRPNGKYYVSLLIETPDVSPLPKTGQTVGIDVGISHLATLSNGVKFDKFNSAFYESQVKRAQKVYSRRYRMNKDSKNTEKARLKLARKHDQLQNARANYIHQVTSQLARQYDVIVVEDIKVTSLLKSTKHMHRHLLNNSWGTFFEILQYNCQRFGKTFLKVDSAYTSQDCSSCQYRFSTLHLSNREWTCPNCDIHHDRDVNAAINIKNKLQ